MIKATDKWFRLLKGIPLNEQTYGVKGGAVGPPVPSQAYGVKGGAVGPPVPAAAPVTCLEGAAFNPKTKKCERQTSMAREATTKKIQQIAKQPARRKPAVKFAQIVVGDIIHGDAHLPEEKRKIKPDGFVGPNTLKAFAAVGIPPFLIGDDPKNRRNWRLANRKIKHIRKALSQKYDAALPHVGVSAEKATDAALAVKITKPTQAGGWPGQPQVSRLKKGKQIPPSEVTKIASGWGGGAPIDDILAQIVKRIQKDAASDGVSGVYPKGKIFTAIGPNSGLRSLAFQRRSWKSAIKKYGSPEKARGWVAKAGFSPHGSGRAIDFYIGPGSGSSKNNEALKGSEAYAWLVKNAHKYGLKQYHKETWHWELNRANRNFFAKLFSSEEAEEPDQVSESKKPDLKESIKIKISEKKTLTEEWWYERRAQDNIAYNKNLGKEFRNMKHVKSGPPFNCNPPSKMAAGIKPAKGSKC